MIDKKNTKIAVIGLGYVGLPLAVEFGKFFETIGFDIDKSRVKQLEDGKDLTLEVETKEHEEGIVVQEVQSGYIMHDRLLRPTMVGVSKKPAKSKED